VSKARKLDIKQFSTVDSKGNKILVDEDCTNNQIDLEVCIVNSNRYYPCPPPERDVTQNRNLFVERAKKFATFLKPLGYDLVPAELQFDFGNLSSFEILNYDDKYENYAKAFLDSLPEEKMPPPYENFKQDFLNLQNAAPKNSLKFFKFEKILKTATCGKQINSLPDLLATVNKKISTMMKKFENAEQELQNIQKSVAEFFDQIPKQVPETCDNAYKMHIENKIMVIEALQWDCKEI
jgi:hypothetical protein